MAVVAEAKAIPVAGSALPGTALVKANAALAAQALSQAEAEQRWKPVLDLQCDLTVDLPMPHFKIADLMQLRQGSVVDARWSLGQDVPVFLNGTQIGWIEFDVVSGHLALRLTELV